MGGGSKEERIAKPDNIFNSTSFQGMFAYLEIDNINTPVFKYRKSKEEI